MEKTDTAEGPAPEEWKIEIVFDPDACPCGYRVRKDEDEPFVLLTATVMIERDFDPPKRVPLWACPKCGTVKMKEY